jgi:spermidine synthase
MDASSHLDTVDINEMTIAVTKKHLGDDARVTFYLIDGEVFIQQAQVRSFDFIYADAIPGKFSLLDETL